jgi:phosphocarrier protein HPr
LGHSIEDELSMSSDSTVRSVRIENLLGLHARPAAQFVQIACRYGDCEIFVRKDDEVVNGKSIMGVMMLAAGMGAELEIKACGDQHSEAVERLCELIENKFGEE